MLVEIILATLVQKNGKAVQSTTLNKGAVIILQQVKLVEKASSIISSLQLVVVNVLKLNLHLQGGGGGHKNRGLIQCPI